MLRNHPGLFYLAALALLFVGLQHSQTEVDAGPNVPGKYVLVTYDVTLKKDLPQGQLSILDDDAAKTFLSKQCTKDPAGNNGWRIVDKTQAFGEDQKIFADMKTNHKQEPWLTVWSGKKKLSIPLPASETEFETKVEKLK